MIDMNWGIIRSPGIQKYYAEKKLCITAYLIIVGISAEGIFCPGYSTMRKLCTLGHIIGQGHNSGLLKAVETKCKVIFSVS